MAGLAVNQLGELALGDLGPVVGYVPRLAQRLVPLAQDDQRLAEVTDVGDGVR